VYMLGGKNNDPDAVEVVHKTAKRDNKSRKVADITAKLPAFCIYGYD